MDEDWTGLRRTVIQLAADNKHRAVLAGKVVVCWSDLLWEESDLLAIIPILVATRVRLATVAVINSWNSVFARPK